MAEITYDRQRLIAREEDCRVSAENLKKNFQEAVVDTISRIADKTGLQRFRSVHERAVKLKEEGIDIVAKFYVNLADTILEIRERFDKRENAAY